MNTDIELIGEVNISQIQDGLNAYDFRNAINSALCDKTKDGSVTREVNKAIDSINTGLKELNAAVTESKNYATTSKSWAEKSQIWAGESKDYSKLSQDSATASAGSASASAGSASASAESASNAKTSEENAKDSEENAKDSVTAISKLKEDIKTVIDEGFQPGQFPSLETFIGDEVEEKVEEKIEKKAGKILYRNPRNGNFYEDAEFTKEFRNPNPAVIYFDPNTDTTYTYNNNKTQYVKVGFKVVVSDSEPLANTMSVNDMWYQVTNTK